MAAILMPPAAAAAALSEVVLDMAVKGAIVLAAAWALARGLRRASAASRHLVWTLALGSLLLLPALSALLPGWALSLPAPWKEAVAALAPQAEPSSSTLAEIPIRGPSLDQGVVPATGPDLTSGKPLRMKADGTAEPIRPLAPAPAAVTVTAWLVLAWAVGSLLAALPVAVGWLSLARLRKDCLVIAEGPLWQAMQESAAQLGLRPLPVLLHSDRREVPMTWGIRRVFLLLPGDAGTWPAERLRAVLLHELAHVQRRDCLTQLLARMACALHWFNPLAWLALTHLRLEQERACDDRVLGVGTNAADYAEHLLRVTADVSSRFFVAPVALAVGQAGRLERRLQAILDPARNRRSVGWRGAVAAVTAGLVVLGLLAPLRVQFARAVHVRVSVQEKPNEELTDEQKANARKLAEVHRLLLQNYVRKLDDGQLTQGAIEGMIKALNDPYTQYLDPKELQAWDRDRPGHYVGVGVQIRLDERKQLLVTTPLEGSPALKAGIRPGDKILAIDKKPTKGLTLQEAVKLILGPADSKVKLKVQHAGGEEVEVTLTRTQLKVRSVAGFHRDDEDRWDFLLDADNGIGYLSLNHIDPGTPAEVTAVLKQFQDKKVKGVILDLRSCPGGFLQGAVDVVRLFLAKEKIVSVKDRAGKEQAWKAENKALVGDLPLVVLLNEETASAAEIIAGALKENERAVLVGARSFGKGSVQNLVKLEDGRGALKVTTHLYYLPTGRSIQKHPGARDWGVDPTDGDYVPVADKQLEKMMARLLARNVVGLKKEDRPKKGPITPQTLAEDEADPQLAAALKTMLERLKTGKFSKVGQPNAAMLANLARKAELQKRRETLQKSLEEVNKELTDLDKGKEPKEKKEE